MSRFNLLPWREERRGTRKREFRRLLVLAALLGLTLVLAVVAFNASRLSNQSERNQRLELENAQLDLRLREVRGLRDEINTLNARRSAVERLQDSRARAVRLLDQLVERVPDGVALTSLKQAERTVLTGHALSNAGVSDFLHALDGEAAGLGRAELVEVKAVTLGQAREARRLVEFAIALEPETSGDEGMR